MRVPSVNNKRDIVCLLSGPDVGITARLISARALNDTQIVNARPVKIAASTMDFFM